MRAIAITLHIEICEAVGAFVRVGVSKSHSAPSEPGAHTMCTVHKGALPPSSEWI
jgi:hypothetical protein